MGFGSYLGVFPLLMKCYSVATTIRVWKMGSGEWSEIGETTGNSFESEDILRSKTTAMRAKQQYNRLLTVCSCGSTKML